MTASSRDQRSFFIRNHPGDNPGANRWFVLSTLFQMLPRGGSICERLTKDLPQGYLQGGKSVFFAGRPEARLALELYPLRYGAPPLKALRGGITKSIRQRPCQFLAINAHEMAPRTT